jgi:hypothetical protein
MKQTSYNRIWTVPFGAALISLGALLALAGCPQDDTADMARQIAQGGRKGSTSLGNGGAGSTSGGAPRAPRGTSAGDQPGLPGKPGEPGKAGEAGASGVPGSPAGEAAAEAETGPKFEAKLLNVKAPYPRFTGAGYYNFDLEITALESIPVSVWKIEILDAKGEIVGKDKQMLVLLENRPKTFNFKSFRCSAMPASVRLVLTQDKAEVVTQTDGKGGSSGSGGSGGAKGGAGSKGGRGGGAGGGAGGSDEEDEGDPTSE